MSVTQLDVGVGLQGWFDLRWGYMIGVQKGGTWSQADGIGIGYFRQGKAELRLGAQRVFGCPIVDLGHFLFGLLKMGFCLGFIFFLDSHLGSRDSSWTPSSITFWIWIISYLGRRLLSIRRIILREIGKVGHTTASYLC
ncbi:hypothetical protein RchiOBHm_Chr6g0274861 [Rosa chinensis]|uniref:Uncharacterized protein n=1 Tax=Rosa chinensis TaxID=74649 RepID=A0A2P6PRU7_ROSCH|nr:hypothetical protein RchiOBHm_Chr6g0274861 [Rosa chinensis]